MRRGDTVGTERLTGQSVALIVKRRANAAGLAPEQLSGHSLRARTNEGFVLDALIGSPSRPGVLQWIASYCD